VTITNRAVPLLHRKEWQMMTPAPVATAAGSFVVHDVADLDNLALLVASATTHYLYHHDEDAWVQIPSGALAGTFGAGACGARLRWSATVTASGGSTTTITTTAAINSLCIGRTVRILSGTAANVGAERTVASVLVTPGGTSTITLTSPLPSPVANADTFAVDVGRFAVLNAGTLAAGAFKFFDALTMTWGANLAITGLPATWGTDGKLISTPSHVAYATGTATAGAATTLTNAAKTWTVNQWSNSQVRITAGTGAGQVRTIASNTATVLTVSSAWTTTPDATSVYSIEGNDDYLYAIGNNAVTLYRYSISANTWSTITPGVARAGAPGAGMTANWVDQTGDPLWANEADIRDGRYIYSLRGGATATLERYDLALNTWAAITYGPLAEVFTTGSSSDAAGRYLYIRKDATNRFFKLSVRGNLLEPLATNLYPDGIAALGDKLWVKQLDSSGSVAWLYSLTNSGTVLHRLMLI
jgi:hypothetical protein